MITTYVVSGLSGSSSNELSDHPVISGISLGDIISYAFAYGYEQG